MLSFLENKRVIALLLLIFHALVSVLLFNLANSEFLFELHNGDGLWNFARDSRKYHQEAINLASLINHIPWSEWFILYPDHLQVPFISI